MSLRTKEYRRLYHSLIRTHPADWDMFREGAHQALGMPPSKMYHHFPDSWLPKGSREHLQTIADTHTPHIMARHLEAEHEDGKLGKTGGGFLDTIKDVATAGAAGFGAVGGYKLYNALKGPISTGLGYASRLGQGTARVARGAGRQALQDVSNIGPAFQGALEQAAEAPVETLVGGLGSAAETAANAAATLVLGPDMGRNFVGEVGNALRPTIEQTIAPALSSWGSYISGGLSKAVNAVGNLATGGLEVVGDIAAGALEGGLGEAVESAAFGLV